MPKIQQGLLIVISAPSGCGKTTLAARLLKRHPEWVKSVSVTTREPRMGEKDGTDYRFVSPAKFQEMERRGEFLENAKVFDHDYGTPKSFVLDQLKKGTHVILTIDVQGMKKIIQALDPSVKRVTIFVLPPSIKILRERLEGRNTDSAEEIENRIALAQEEIKEARFYDYTVMNQNLEQTVLELETIVEKIEKK